MLNLELNQDPATLVPGQRIEGKFSWNLQKPPQTAFVRLFWYTEGRGDQDVGIVAEHDVHTPSASHSATFQFDLPDSPCSFNGQLISLKWAIELVINKGKEVERIDLQVSPWVEVVTLGKAPGQD